jgi:hypothetical protein
MMGGLSPDTCCAIKNIGIINYTTRLHLVGCFYEIYITLQGSMKIKFINIILKQNFIFLAGMSSKSQTKLRAINMLLFYKIRKLVHKCCMIFAYLFTYSTLGLCLKSRLSSFKENNLLEFYYCSI